MVSASGQRCITNAPQTTRPDIGCPSGDWTLIGGQCQTTVQAKEIRTTVDRVQYEVPYKVRVAPFTAQVRIAPYTETVRVAPFTETVTQTYTRRQRYCAQYDTEFGTGCLRWAYRNVKETVTETVDAYNYKTRDVYHYETVDAYNYETRTRWECCKSVVREETVTVNKIKKRDPTRTCPATYTLDTNTNHCKRPAGTKLGKGTLKCKSSAWTLDSINGSCSRSLPSDVRYSCNEGDTEVTPRATPPLCSGYVCPNSHELDSSTTLPICVRYICADGYQLDSLPVGSTKTTRTCSLLPDDSESEPSLSYTHEIGGRWDGDVECDRSGLVLGVHTMVSPDSVLMPSGGTPFVIIPGTAGRLCIDASPDHTLIAVIVGAATELGCAAVTIGGAALLTKLSGGTLAAYLAAHPGAITIAQSVCTSLVGGAIDTLLPAPFGGKPDLVIAPPGSQLGIGRPPVRHDGDVECDPSGLLHGVHAMVLPDSALLPSGGSPFVVIPGTAGRTAGSLCFSAMPRNPVIVFVEQVLGNTVCSAIEFGSEALVRRFTKGTLQNFVDDNRNSMVVLNTGCAGFVAGTSSAILPDPIGRRADAVVRLPTTTEGQPKQDTDDDQDKTDAQTEPSVSITGGGGVTEGGRVTFTVSATPVPTVPLTVDVSVTSSGDFGVTTGSRQVTISTSGTGSLTVTTADDSTNESDGSVTVTVDDGSGYTVPQAASSASVAVTDDDNPSSTSPSISISGGSAVTEGATASFTLAASPAPSAAVTVNINVTSIGGFATTGAQTVTIPTTGSTTLNVPTIADSVDELDGSVTVVVAAGTGYSVGSSSTATVTVSDDDTAAPQSSLADVSFTAPSGGTSASLNGRGPFLARVTFTPGAPVVPLQLPGACGTVGTVTYQLVNFVTGNPLGNGLAFDATTRTIAGTPTTSWNGIYRLVVTDAGGTADARADKAGFVFQLSVHTGYVATTNTSVDCTDPAT